MHINFNSQTNAHISSENVHRNSGAQGKFLIREPYFFPKMLASGGGGGGGKKKKIFLDISKTKRFKKIFPESKTHFFGPIPVKLRFKKFSHTMTYIKNVPNNLF